MPRIKVENFGPIKSADVEFGDLSIFVGPQATGKSIFFQLLKFILDPLPIRRELENYSLFPENDFPRFLDIYFGEGMASLYNDSTTHVKWNNGEINLRELNGAKKNGASKQKEKAFLIPAQRVLTLQNGMTHPFGDYRLGDPFSVRNFSHKLHTLLQTWYGDRLFPAGCFNEIFSARLSQNVFGNYMLLRDTNQQKRLVLKTGRNAPLPYLVWSAGQREFVPLLLGLGWLTPPETDAKRPIDWVMIEELEMGLHPSAISSVMLLVMELLQRGYRVCLTTHSPHVLDIAWALRIIKEKKGTAEDFCNMFKLDLDAGDSSHIKNLANKILKDKSTSVHYFTRDGVVKDISALDPSSDENDEAGWGGLSEFSGHVGDIVARVVNRNEGYSK